MLSVKAKDSTWCTAEWGDGKKSYEDKSEEGKSCSVGYCVELVGMSLFLTSGKLSVCIQILFVFGCSIT